MNVISANELKTKGVGSISKHLANDTEAIITVRGNKRYVVMDLEHYHYLRECELEAALMEARTDIESGNFVVESVKKHIERLKNGKEI
jgi:hypothetical protein